MSLLDTTERRDLAAAADLACASETPWPRLLDLGLADLSHDVDGGWTTELAIIASAFGARATVAPFIGRVLAARTVATTGAAQADLDTTAASQVWLDGRPVVASERDGRWTVSGVLDVVPDLDGATRVLLVADGRLLSVSTDDAAATGSSLDPGTSIGRVTLDETPAELVAEAGDWDAESVRLDAALLLAAIAAGASRAVVDDAVAFAGQRFQFGRAIGSFQAVRHRLVDMTLAADRASIALAEAAAQADHQGLDTPLYSTMAALTCTGVYEQVAAAAIQVHGGIGFTWEHPAHRHLKRARVLAELCGPRHRLLTSVADAVGLTA